VLVLSRFAGAARELKSALIVNPYDIDGTADALNRALSMPLDERCERWSAMMQTLRGNTIVTWRRNYLGALDARCAAERYSGEISEIDIDADEDATSIIEREIGRPEGTARLPAMRCQPPSDWRYATSAVAPARPQRKGPPERQLLRPADVAPALITGTRSPRTDIVEDRRQDG
jgi:hypothetical protein